MERKIAETFNFNDIKLKVEQNDSCDNCYFYDPLSTFCLKLSKKLTGDCINRSDDTSVIFTKIEE